MTSRLPHIVVSNAEERAAIEWEANGGALETPIDPTVPTSVPQGSEPSAKSNRKDNPKVRSVRSHVPTVPGNVMDLADRAKAGTSFKDPEDEAVPIEREGPVPLSEVSGPVPGFPLEVLPSWLAEYCTSVADYLEVPTELCGMLALAVLSTAMNGKVEAQPREGWHEATNLYILCVAASAERKSPVYKFFYAVAHAWEAETRKRVAADVAASVAEHHAYVKSLARAETTLSTAETEEEKAKAQASIKEIAAYLSENPEPHLPRLFVDDVSSEKLAETIARFGGRITLASPEGHGFFARAGGLYSRGDGPLDVFLKAHSGESIQVDRIGRSSLNIARPALTLCLCLQPAVLRGLAKNKPFRGTGLLARFLIAVPDPRVGTRTHETTPVPKMVRSAYEHRMKALLDLRAPSAGEELPIVMFNAEASLALRSFMKQLEPRLQPITGDLAGIADWAGKLAGQTARVATLIHCADHALDVGQLPQDIELALATMQKAITIARFLLDHARRGFSALDGGDETDRALFVLSRIRGLGKTEITRKDLLRACRTVRAKELTEIIDRLVEHGYLTPLLPGTSKKQRYRVIGSDGNIGNEVEAAT